MEIGTKEKMEQGNYWFKEEEKKSRIARGSELEKRQVYEEERGGGQGDKKSLMLLKVHGKNKELGHELMFSTKCSEIWYVL